MPEAQVAVLNEFGERLFGLVNTPRVKKAKYPTVVLVHGFGSDNEQYGLFDGLAGCLSEAGFLVYRFNFSGRGNSEGDYENTSLSKLKNELERILIFVRQRPEVDISRIGIWGQSFGTSVVIALEPKVNCIALSGAISHPNAVLKNLFADGYNPDGISTRVKVDGEITKIKPQFWKDLKDHNLLESVKKIHSPILFVHGSRDTTVPVSEMEEYFLRANDPKEKIIVKGAVHNFEPHREELCEIAVGWFKRHLK